MLVAALSISIPAFAVWGSIAIHIVKWHPASAKDILVLLIPATLFTYGAIIFSRSAIRLFNKARGGLKARVSTVLDFQDKKIIDVGPFHGTGQCLVQFAVTGSIWDNRIPNVTARTIGLLPTDIEPSDCRILNGLEVTDDRSYPLTDFYISNSGDWQFVIEFTHHPETSVFSKTLWGRPAPRKARLELEFWGNVQVRELPVEDFKQFPAET